MTRAQRFAWRLSLALLTVAGGDHRDGPGTHLYVHARGHVVLRGSHSTYTGACDALVTEAIQNIWPQTSDYCGVETALGAVNDATTWRGSPRNSAALATNIGWAALTTGRGARHQRVGICVPGRSVLGRATSRRMRD